MAQHARLWSLFMAKLKDQLQNASNGFRGMHWTTTYPNFSFLGQKLWPLDSKRFIFETPFARPILLGEMVQTPELSHISTDRDKIWCVKTLKVDLDSYQISSGWVEKPLSYEAFSFYYKIVILLHFIVW